MRKILTSLLVIVGVGAVAAFGVTRAFFSDTETSTGNTFQAGDIDLKIDNTSYYNGIASSDTSWDLADLTIQKFFNFNDIKPGDWGEDTISIHAGSNDAYVCANAQVSANADNGITEPEDEVGGPAGDDGTPDGDLAAALNFVFWSDDGDNVLETDEPIITQGPASNVLSGGTLTLADSVTNNVEGSAPSGLTGNTIYHIGKAWCYGALTTAALPPAAYANPITATNFDDGATDIVTSRDGGVICDGSTAGNIGQTDILVGDISFYATQTRNNSSFLCNQVVFPTAVPFVPTSEP